MRDHTSLPKHIHLVGIGGAGLSGAARILHGTGHRITGHDRAPSVFLDELVEAGLAISTGEEERPPLPEGTELLACSAAVPSDDPDRVRASELGIPVVKYAQLLGRLAPPSRTLAVAGTHGKTSVSWMLTHALEGLERAVGAGAPRTGCLIGGLDLRRMSNAAVPGEGGWFVAEACEYDRSFLQLSPTGAVVTNVEADHLDYYGSLEAIERAFARFVHRIHPEGLLVVGDQVPGSVEDASRAHVWRLGREFDIELIGEQRGCFDFRLIGPGWATPPLSLSLPGRYQVENAALAIALVIGRAAHEWKIEPAQAVQDVAKGIERFGGVARRFETWGVENGVEVIHDFAHHPTEVHVTLEAARRALPDKPLHVLFQPHQHSRTARFLHEFVESLRGVDRVVVADVYGARAHIDRMGADACDLAGLLRRAGVDAVAGGDLASSIVHTITEIPARSALLVLGAGDVETIRDDLFTALALRSIGTSGAIG
jgi:UDP-N-acetylmuramate--alanine ligase